MSSLTTHDWIVFLVYFIFVASYGLWVYFKKRKAKTSTGTTDYFLAEGTLTWWAIGASLIASNISAEQMIGMSGNGFKMGLAISTYEWMAALTLVIVAVFFIPVYLKNKIFTMPQFLNQRYNGTVALIMAIFWLLLYIIVNLTSILFLGALAVNSISGIDFRVCIWGLAIFAVFITLGGMKVIGFTDVIQVFFLILGGLVTTYIALQLVASHFGQNGVVAGFHLLMSHANDHFHMIIKRDNPNYFDLPGLSVLVGGMWIVNLNYWGCNQYITQRALGADLKTARGGILFAAFLKLLMPVIVVLPGIAAYILYRENIFHGQLMQNGELNPDRSYPVLLNLLPSGLKGLSFAALTAAVVASLAGKANSISTIFTLDIYRKAFNPKASEKHLVVVGKVAVCIAMILGVVISPFMGIDKKGGFQYIQEYTGFVSPGIFAMFLLGFFWKRTTSSAAVFSAVGGFGLSVLLKFLPGFMNLSFLAPFGFSKANDSGVYEIPFLDRMGIVFVICFVGMILISFVTNPKNDQEHGLEVDTTMFKTSKSFAFGALIICGILAALYTIFW
jgi:solute:Na+ symporter, SSS family